MLTKVILNEDLTMLFRIFYRKVSLEILPLSILIMFNSSTHLSEPKQGEIVNVNCLPASIGILPLEKRIGERASKQLKIATQRARKRTSG